MFAHPSGKGRPAAGLQNQTTDSNAAMPKQFWDLAGEPMYVHSLRALSRSAIVNEIVIVLPAERPQWAGNVTDLPKVISVADGGPTRQASLVNGLVCVNGDTDLVLVHDAARPLINEQLIESVAAAMDDVCDGAICAVPMEDSVKEVSMEGWILRPLNRKPMWRAQTPQIFKLAVLEEALARASAEGVETEDCSELLTRLGQQVKVTEGNALNLKVTRVQDLSLAETILKNRAGPAEELNS